MDGRRGLTWERVRAWRLARQHLDRRAPKRRFLEVAGDLCGVHAQVQSSADLQLWARVEGITPADLREALWQRRSLVRTWAMRGTLHVLRDRLLAGHVFAEADEAMTAAEAMADLRPSSHDESGLGHLIGDTLT